MSKVLIIAEAGVNHNGSMEMAKALVDEAASAGADIIKFQTFKSSELVIKSAPKAHYQTQTTSASESQLDMLRALELSESMHKELIAHCSKRNIEFLSTPFDLGSVDLLVNTFGLDRLKLPSGDITFAPILLKAARTQKKIIISTGMSTLAEVEQALGVLAFGYLNKNVNPTLAHFEDAYLSEEGQRVLQENVTLLHCTSEYPAPFKDVNLRAMQTMSQAFALPVGLSDHTAGIAVPIAAVALGATVIEKHITLDCSLPGPDHKASLPPNALRDMVRSIREVELSLGSARKLPTASESKNRPLVRRSIVAARDMQSDEYVTIDDLAFKRPGHGISPMLFWNYVGIQTKKAFSKDDPF